MVSSPLQQSNLVLIFLLCYLVELYYDIFYYADDTAILVRHTSIEHVTRLLQKALDELEDWFRLWRIDVNPAKNVAVLFSRRGATPAGELTVFGEEVEWKPSAKYLGVTLAKGLRFKQDIEMARNKACATIRLLYPLTNRKIRLNSQSKLAIYKSIIISGMTYASLAWGHAAHTHMHKLQVIQNKTLRTIFNAPWYVRNEQLHREANIPYLSEYMTKTATKAFARAETHTNPLLQEAIDYDLGDYHIHKRPRMAAT
ncbi:PREDICTED: RNA-directed DNA polymerase from mobile element jockey-like [Nicrophorus vespilloides]|uniref:RNA-directed DNA polymerase from mobile element jockey-like n=1 Tax=Nicrophorus vespilloides TaxID=110193 RepID=A0ABM1NIW3_NICVS|nr:PREDICTED: RNA-directed DNA polymerase from mobile element jockey-like [Nicrophorus vespilloides]